MYLMKHEHMTKPAAYDLARREFYDVRHAQETERRIAKEEALHYGAYFGKSTLEIGEELEDQVWEGWKTSALAHLDEVQAQRTQAVSTFSQEGESDEIPDDGIVAEPQTVEAPMTRGELQGALEEVAPSIPASRRGQEAYGGAPLRPGPTP